MKLFKKIAIAAALTTSLVLVGCFSSSDGSSSAGNSVGSNSVGSNSDGSNSDGSNSDGSNSDGSNSDGSNSVGSNSDGSNSDGDGYTVSGAAVKGILKNAKVTAYELQENGERKAGTVGTTHTDNEGNYTLTLTSAYTDGVLDIEVTSDTQTKMVCDAKACNVGSEIEVKDLELNSLVVKEKDQDAKDIPVTAWTSMAANLAKETAKKTGGDIKTSRFNASSAVTELAGFDVANTPAKAITDDLKNATPAEQQAAIMNAVVAEMMTDGFDAKELEDFSNAMNEEGDFKKANSTSTSGINLNTLATKTEKVVAESQKTLKLSKETKDKLAEQQATLDEVKTEGVKDKEPMGKTPSYTRTTPPKENPRADIEVKDLDSLIVAVEKNYQAVTQDFQLKFDDALISTVELPMLHYLLTNDPASPFTDIIKDMFSTDREYEFDTPDFNKLEKQGVCKNGSVETLNPNMTSESFSGTFNYNLCKNTEYNNQNIDLSGIIAYSLDEGESQESTGSGKLEVSLGSEVKMLMHNLNRAAEFKSVDNVDTETIISKVDYIKASFENQLNKSELEVHGFYLHQAWSDDNRVAEYSGDFVLADFVKGKSVKIKMTSDEAGIPTIVVSSGADKVTIKANKSYDFNSAEVNYKIGEVTSSCTYDSNGTCN